MVAALIALLKIKKCSSSYSYLRDPLSIYGVEFFRFSDYKAFIKGVAWEFECPKLFWESFL